MATTQSQSSELPRSGLEDVAQSLRAVLRATRDVGELSGDVVEREIAMAIRISEDIRDRVVSQKTLEEARRDPLMARLRHNSHRAVDLFADATSVTFISGRRFLEQFADQPREPLASVNQRLEKAP